MPKLRKDRPTWRLRCLEALARPQHGVLGCRVAERRAEEDVGREVGVLGDARGADRRGQGVGEDGNPALAAVTVGDDRGDGECRGCMARGEAAASEWRLAAVEKR